MMNILNGGAHADSSVDFQEFMVMPVGAPSFAEARARGRGDLPHAARHPEEEGATPTGVGDEGGFAPSLSSNREALDVVLEAVAQAGYKPGENVYLALDVASSELWNDDASTTSSRSRASKTRTRRRDGRAVRGLGAAVSDHLDRGRPRRRRLGRLEDADHGARRPRAAGRRRRVRDQPGDPEARHRREGIGNALLVKLNQIGTVTETLDAVAMARDAGYASVISHRSGETEDTTIADLAVATGAGQIKTGSASRTDRVAKYNQLLRIEEELGSGAHATPGAARDQQPRASRNVALVLIVLDGWGIRARTRQQRHRAGAHARVRRAAARAIRTRS